LNFGNALQVFLIANNLRATTLRKACLEYMCHNIASIPTFLDGIFVVGKSCRVTLDVHLDIIQLDPRTKAQSNIGRFPYRPWASLASLENSLFLIGGDYPYTAKVAAFDVVEKRQRNVPRMLEARGFAAVASSTRAVLVCGGGESLFSCELFQPSARRWILMPPMERARCAFQVIWLSDGRIFAIGGWNDGEKLDSVEMLHREWAFDGETTGKWRQCSPMLAARDDFAAVALHGKVVLVAGGFSFNGMWLDSVDLFTPPPAAGDPCALGQWTNLQPMQSAPQSQCTGVFSGGVVFIFGEESSKIQRFRPSLMHGNLVEFTDWSWDEELSLTTVSDSILSATFK